MTTPVAVHGHPVAVHGRHLAPDARTYSVPLFINRTDHDGTLGGYNLIVGLARVALQSPPDQRQR